MEAVEWIKLTLVGRSEDAEVLSAVMSMLDEGLLIEDLSDLSADSPYGEVLSCELAAADRTTCAVSVFLPADRPIAEAAAFVRERVAAVGACGRGGDRGHPRGGLGRELEALLSPDPLRPADRGARVGGLYPRRGGSVWRKIRPLRPSVSLAQAVVECHKIRQKPTKKQIIIYI